MFKMISSTLLIFIGSACAGECPNMDRYGADLFCYSTQKSNITVPATNAGIPSQYKEAFDKVSSFQCGLFASQLQPAAGGGTLYVAALDTMINKGTSASTPSCMNPFQCQSNSQEKKIACSGLLGAGQGWLNAKCPANQSVTLDSSCQWYIFNPTPPPPSKRK